MDVPHDQPLPAGTLLAGKYEIRRRLGSGGMGAVYEARHVRMNKRVAVKVIHPQFAKNGEAVGRFLREAEAASRIRHPNVIDVVDIDERHDPPFMVLEFLEGQSLATVLERDQKLSLGATAALLQPVLGAVAAAHDAGIVHRDLKPENIFIARAGDGSIRPVVLDFGVAKIEDSAIQGLTQTNAMVGTVVYMSPEQARDSKRVDPKSDQYTLGVILYECVSGVRPCDGDSLYLVLNAIVEAKYRPLRERAPGISAAFEAIVARAMSVDPAQRFASVRAMAEALAPLAEGQRFQFSRDSWATEFAFGSTMSADGSSDSAVVRAVEAVVGARPGAISADEHAQRASTPAALTGPTLAEPVASPVVAAKSESAPARAAAPSTLGGSSIEVSSPLHRDETIGVDPRRANGRRGLALVLVAVVLGSLGAVALSNRSAPATPAVTDRRPPPDRAPEPLHVAAREPAAAADSGATIAVMPANIQANVDSAQRTVAHSQTPAGSPRTGRRPTTGLTASPTNPAAPQESSRTPSTNPQTAPSGTAAGSASQTPTEGPRQVGGGFVL